MTTLPEGSVTIPDGVMIRDLGGEGVLLNLRSETYFGLDAVGMDMWRALTTSPTVEAAFEALQDTYDVDTKRLRQDLAEFIASLEGAGLLEVQGLQRRNPR